MHIILVYLDIIAARSTEVGLDVKGVFSRALLSQAAIVKYKWLLACL